jgi:hypothetical protein
MHDGRQTVGPGHGLDKDIPAVAAVAAVGPTMGYVLLTPKAAAPCPAVAALNINLNTIDEHKNLLNAS